MCTEATVIGFKIINNNKIEVEREMNVALRSWKRSGELKSEIINRHHPMLALATLWSQRSPASMASPMHDPHLSVLLLWILLAFPAI